MDDTKKENLNLKSNERDSEAEMPVDHDPEF
jgi:hypothetical protein